MNFILNRNVSLMFSVTTNCQKRKCVCFPTWFRTQQWIQYRSHQFLWWCCSWSWETCHQNL